MIGKTPVTDISTKLSKPLILKLFSMILLGQWGDDELINQLI